MHRLLFNEFEIDDQNHDFLTHKQYFIEVFKNHVFSEIFKDKISLTDYGKMKQYFDEKIVGTSVENSTNVYEIEIISFKRNNYKYSNIEISYSPNLPINVTNRRISFYKVESSDYLNFDHETVYNSIVKKLKKFNTMFTSESKYEISNIPSIDNGQSYSDNTSIKVVLNGNISVVDSIWEMIRMLEFDFFRFVEKSDLQ